jgi:hypothetical protein
MQYRELLNLLLIELQNNKIMLDMKGGIDYHNKYIKDHIRLY